VTDAERAKTRDRRMSCAGIPGPTPNATAPGRRAEKVAMLHAAQMLVAAGPTLGHLRAPVGLSVLAPGSAGDCTTLVISYCPILF
jgi:hypothetical protein